MFDKNTYINRRNKLRSLMSDGIVLLPGNVDSPMNCLHNTFHFRQDSTFLYFFGLDFQGLCGIIDIDNNTDTIYGDDVDLEDIIWMGNQISLKEKAVASGVEKTASFSKAQEAVAKAISQGRRVHFLPPYRGENMMLLENFTGIHTSKLKQYASLELIQNIVTLRSIKEACEIVELEKACAVGHNMHIRAMQMAKAGNTEYQVAGEIEGVALAGGGMLSFPVILSQHGEILHNHNHANTLEEGKLMLCDAGAETASHYASDFTRTIPVGGKFSTRQKEVYEIVLAANNNAMAAMKPGVTNAEMHQVAARTITEGLQGLGLMKGNIDESLAAGAHAMFFPHGLGHMLGLDVHDMEDYGQIHVGYDDEIRPSEQFGTCNLRLGRRLQEGFVITNEPGVYFIPALHAKWKQDGINKDFINFDKAEGYLDFGGIRLEDDLLITKTGAEFIGKRVPITVEEVEAAARG